MFKRFSHLVIASSFTLAACSTHKANFAYQDVSDLPIKAGALNGEEVGTVEGSHGGAIWNECDDEAKRAVQEMVADAKAKGANAVGNIRWSALNNDQASCKKSWGLLIVWPFVLTPLFMSSKITGTAYKTNAKHAAAKGWLMLPTTAQEETAFMQQLTM